MATTRDNDHRIEEDDTTPLEQAFAGLLSAVLSPDERQLLVAFEAITDRKVRRSLIDVACAAAGIPDGEATPREPEDSRALGLHRTSLGGDKDTITLRRVRRSLLRPRVGKGPP